MARYTAVRRTDSLRIPVARIVFDGDGTDGTDFDGVAQVIADTSYYVGGPRGSIAEAPFVHIYGPDSRLVMIYDLRSHEFPRPAQAPVDPAAAAKNAEFFFEITGVRL